MTWDYYDIGKEEDYPENIAADQMINAIMDIDDAELVLQIIIKHIHSKIHTGHFAVQFTNGIFEKEKYKYELPSEIFTSIRNYLKEE
jgi:hypothetical protein